MRNVRNARQNMSTEKTIKEWELEKGIILLDTKGFRMSKSRAYSQKYSDRYFRTHAQMCTVQCKTDKGFNFLNK